MKSPDIDRIIDEVNSWELPVVPTVFEFAKFVEAKLKEKNGG